MKEKNIKKWIIIFPILGVILIAIILTIINLEKTKEHYDKEFQLMVVNKKKNAQNIIKERILTTETLINSTLEGRDHHDMQYIKNRIQSILNMISYDDIGYIFAYDLKGNTISHIKKNLVGTNRWNHKKNGEFIIQNMIQKAKRDNAFYIEYLATVNPKTNLPAQKVSYVKLIDSIGWIIGTGIYVDDLEQDIRNEKELILNQDLVSYSQKIAMISILVTLIGILIMGYIAKRTYEIIDSYQKRLLNQNKALEKKVKLRTKEQNALLELFDQTDSVLYKWNSIKGEFNYISKSVLKIWGYSEQEFLSKELLFNDCIHPEDLKKYRQEFIQAIKERQSYFIHNPYRIKTEDGQIKWVHDCKLIIRNKHNKIDSLIGYITDITSIKKQEKLLIEQNKMSSLADMIQNLAHQWRQPLSAISTQASGMQLYNEMEILDKKNIKTSVESIVKNCQYLSQTIDSLNNYSHHENIQEVLVLEDTVNKCIDLLQNSITTQNITIKINIEENLNYYDDEQDIMQILMNIINNAIDQLSYKEEGFNKKITIVGSREKNNFFIEIQDNAGGINDDIVDKIFEPYFTTKHQSLGAGMDLYITKKLIENKQGAISVMNKIVDDEKGAFFHISLPLNIESFAHNI